MQKIKAWIDTLGYKDYKIEMLVGDASFRKYFRLFADEKSYIIMDSSADLDSLYPFIDISVRLLKAKVEVPRIIAQNLQDGYLLITDLGSRHLADVLSPMSVELLYMKAINEIIKMQEADTTNMDVYDREFLMFEMNIMQEWYMNEYLHQELSHEEQSVLDNSLEMIANEVLSQPQGYFVHRDFHSKNIMMETGRKLVIIDYQDGKIGALTYDLVSLLKDVYVRFEPKQMEELALEFKTLKGIDVSDEQFIRWFDFMGLQRHIKILGIFARLDIRDGKPAHLDDIPLTLEYIDEVCSKYEELKPLGKLFKR
ncbi:COG3178: Predicted phosphotransferase related to Ser/Thr protein kinases [hydrothermal vent metagenome]|uniref:COG3178: Predicted phosphotransferase related to Ser/Thr protein kinases n=1 Tax=hydrothermal vent metagenome TaxID=652676 RepID=A0A1W1BLC5_9ZZZZ